MRSAIKPVFYRATLSEEVFHGPNGPGLKFSILSKSLFSVIIKENMWAKKEQVGRVSWRREFGAGETEPGMQAQRSLLSRWQKKQ